MYVGSPSQARLVGVCARGALAYISNNSNQSTPLEPLCMEDGLDGRDIDAPSRPGLDENGHAPQEVHLIASGQVVYMYGSSSQCVG